MFGWRQENHECNRKMEENNSTSFEDGNKQRFHQRFPSSIKNGLISVINVLRI